jgi:L-ribulose-5-phosphate 4-epimerase
MQLPELRAQVLEANRQIAARGLALHTFGNASGIHRPADGSDPIVVIKPSGVAYETLTASDLVLTRLDGSRVEGTLRPSSDLDTHLELYRAFPQIGGIVHTHSTFATTWAQAGKPIPCLGTTHADYFHTAVPVTGYLTEDAVSSNYVLETGRLITDLFTHHSLDPVATPGVLVAGHAPFAWGANPADAVEHADLLEFIARLAWQTAVLGLAGGHLPEYIAAHHHRRKHGPNATYGQEPSASV